MQTYDSDYQMTVIMIWQWLWYDSDYQKFSTTLNMFDLPGVDEISKDFFMEHWSQRLLQ